MNVLRLEIVELVGDLIRVKAYDNNNNVIDDKNLTKIQLETLVSSGKAVIIKNSLKNKKENKTQVKSKKDTSNVVSVAEKIGRVVTDKNGNITVKRNINSAVKLDNAKKIIPSMFGLSVTNVKTNKSRSYEFGEASTGNLCLDNKIIGEFCESTCGGENTYYFDKKFNPIIDEIEDKYKKLTGKDYYDLDCLVQDLMSLNDAYKAFKNSIKRGFDGIAVMKISHYAAEFIISVNKGEKAETTIKNYYNITKDKGWKEVFNKVLEGSEEAEVRYFYSDFDFITL